MYMSHAEVCHGKRYNLRNTRSSLQRKSIADILEMTVEDAVEFFQPIPKIHRKLQTIVDVGLGMSRWDNQQRHCPVEKRNE